MANDQPWNERVSELESTVADLEIQVEALEAIVGDIVDALGLTYRMRLEGGQHIRREDTVDGRLDKLER